MTNPIVEKGILWKEIKARGLADQVASYGKATVDDLRMVLGQITFGPPSVGATSPQPPTQTIQATVTFTPTCQADCQPEARAHLTYQPGWGWRLKPFGASKTPHFVKGAVVIYCPFCGRLLKYE